MRPRPATLNVGQCTFCRYRKTIASARGSQFVLCQLANSDKKFAKYPRLPVTGCSGFVALEQLEKVLKK